jgi:hypothetical protein
MQTICEDWEAPGRILEIQDAVLNFAAVWHALWELDPSPLVLHRALLNINWGGLTGEDEKSRVR